MKFRILVDILNNIQYNVNCFQKWGDKMNAFEYYRKKVLLTQEEAAGALGLNRSTVTKWETGVALPATAKLNDIADLYHCTIDALLREPIPEEGKG